MPAPAAGRPADGRPAGPRPAVPTAVPPGVDPTRVLETDITALEGPTRTPPRPSSKVEPRPEDVVFEVEAKRGAFRRFPDGEAREIFVMVGNPRIRGFEHRRSDGLVAPPFSLKANAIVLWVDRGALDPLGVLEDVRASVEGAVSGNPGSAAVQSILQEAILGIYASGAVELVFGDLEFRAEQLHIEPRTFQALLVEPRFRGLSRGSAEHGGDLPLFIRARRARLVSKGVAVFDDADVGATRAHDRMELRVKTLTVEELEEGTEATSPEDPNLLGFRNLSAQSYQAQGAQLRGERLPLFYWPNAEFGYPEGESFPVTFKRFIYGNRSTLGRYLMVGLGGVIGPSSDPWAEWVGLVGGYTGKGPAAGAEFEWQRPTTFGKLRSWGVYDFEQKDFNDYIPPEAFRWLVNFEQRTRLGRNWQIDAEFHDFSDRNVNLEFWENEDVTHKEYESYVRPRYENGTFVGALTAKWHQRSFATETLEAPQLDLRFLSVPLLTPRRRGGLGLDVSSVSRAGYLERVYDDALPRPPNDTYSSWRLQTDTRLNMVFDLSDVRVSSYAGFYGASYLDRSHGESDLQRAALVAGTRANLQMHRSWGSRGGLFQLDRLRHVLDVDAGFQGIWFDHDDVDEVPYYDMSDDLYERSAATLRLRNRIQTRRASGEGTRDVLDLELTWAHWVDDQGPWDLEGPGEIDYWLRGEPRENTFIGGEGRFDLQAGDFYRASLGLGSQVHERLTFFTGVRYIRGAATAPFVDVAWRFSEKYGVRIFEEYDFRREFNRTRLVFGRYASDHAWFFGLSYRGRDDVGIEFNFTPTIGTGGSRGRLMFNDQPDPDQWELYP